MAGAVRQIEIINDQGLVFGKQSGPGIAEVAVAAVLAQDGFVAGGDVGTFGIKDASADTKRRMAVAIDEQDLAIRQSERVVRVPHETSVLPRLKALAVIGGAGNRGMIIEVLRAHKRNEIASRRFKKGSFVESSFLVGRNQARMVPIFSPV